MAFRPEDADEHMEALLDTDDNKLGYPYREETVMKDGHSGAVLVVRFNSDGGYCLSGGKDRTVVLWNPHKGTKIKTYKGTHGYEVLDVRVTKDSTRFASCGGDRLVFLWDVATGSTISRFRGHTERINTIFFNPDESILCSGSYDKTIRCWDLRSRNTKDGLQTLAEFNDSVSSLVVTDHEIIAGSIDGKLRTYDLRMGQLVTDYIAHPVTHVTLSRDGQCVLLSCLDSTLRLFDKASGEMLCEYTGHRSEKYKIEACLTNSDAHVVGGSEDGQIRIWKLVEGEIVETLKGHTKEVVSLDYHPTKTCLVTASSDGSIRCWK